MRKICFPLFHLYWKVIFNFFKHMLLRYIFVTILAVVPDTCYMVKMASIWTNLVLKILKYLFIHNESNITSTYLDTFWRWFFWCCQIYAMTQNGCCKQFIFKFIIIQRPGGIIRYHLCVFIGFICSMGYLEKYGIQVSVLQGHENYEIQSCGIEK